MHIVLGDNRMKVDVFGSTGFIGNEYMLHSKHESFRIPRDCRKSCSEQILYFIGTTDNYNIFENPFLDINTNLEILIETLEEFRKSNSNSIFNFVSSWFVYGKNEPPFKETDNCLPMGFYSITKYTAELLLQSYCKTFELNYRIFRLANVYGVNDKKVSPRKNALQYMIAQLKKDEKITLYENGEIKRDFINVLDVIDAIDLILDVGEINEIYNIGTGQGTKIGEIVQLAAKIIDSKSSICSVNTPKFHQLIQTRDSYLDIDKISRLGFKSKYEIKKDLPVLCN